MEEGEDGEQRTRKRKRRWRRQMRQERGRRRRNTGRGKVELKVRKCENVLRNTVLLGKYSNLLDHLTKEQII